MDNIRILGDVEITKSLQFTQNYTAFPENPKPRTLVVKDGTPYIYTELINGSGFFSWAPIGIKQTAYLHTQGVASTVWTVTHNLNVQDFAYFVYDNNHDMVVANNTVVNNNTIRIELAEAITGTAVIFGVEHLGSTNLSAYSDLNVGTITLRDSSGVLTVNNNDVAMQTAVDAADAALSDRIDAALSNLDPVALDSLTEVVNAFQLADGSLDNAISSLADTAASGLAAEIIRATAAEAAAVGAAASDATTKANAAQAAAIAAAAIDATAKADTAQSAATAAAAGDASSKVAAEATARDTAIATAKSQAISTAASDATTKANAAQAAAATDATTKVAAEATARDTAIATAKSAAISTAASDATAKVAAEATARDIAIATAKSEAISTAASDATTKADAAAVLAVSTVKTYLGAVTEDIVPATDLGANLGSPTKQFHSLYVGPGTLYVNGKAVIQDNSDTMTFGTDPDQNMRLQTSGSGHLELQAAAGTIDVKGTLSIESGKRIVDSAGTQVQFGDDIQLNGNKVIGLGAPVTDTDAATKKYVDDRSTSDSTLVRTVGAQTIAGVKSFSDDVTVAGNLVVSGTTTTVNSETIKLADNLIDLNSNFTAGAPTENAGIRIMRGDEAASQVRWNESTDKWEVSADSSTFSVIAVSADVTAAIGTAASDATAKVAAEATARDTAIATAKSAAISTAASDATAKVATAKSEAISTAASDATTKVAAEATARDTAIATAKSEAISTAASDATAKVAAEATIARAAEAALGVRIDNVLSNTDATALNSLSELVTAFQSADGNLTSSISSLSTSAASALATEITNRETAVTAAIGTAASDATAKVAAEATIARAAEALLAPKASPTFTGTVSGITKAMVGLVSVDNTADYAKPVSAAQATAIATAKSEAIGTAASDATAKANAAQAAAASDATAKAAAAQAAAIAAVTNGAGAAFDTLKEIQDAMATDTELASAIAAISNVPSATKLQTARTIQGVSFDGTAPITVVTAGTGISVSGTTVTSTITQYTDALARAAHSFAAGSGAYNSSTGVITIPTNTNQLTNGAGYITGYTETSTLAAVTGRGATTTAAISTGAHTITGSPVTALINGGTAGTGNIGASGAGFNTVFAKATSAQYADLAENYAADAVYVPGTVVEFGGDQEVTLATEAGTSRVAGVVSTAPAYLMNSTCASEHVAAVALQGRVPCFVTGAVRKGDLMVSAGNGMAKADNSARAGTIIGKALANFDGETGTIEVVIGRF